MTELHVIAQPIVNGAVMAIIVLPSEYVLFRTLGVSFTANADQD